MRRLLILSALLLGACSEAMVGGIDGGVPGTGGPDAGLDDAGTRDAGTADAGTADAGTTDAGPPPESCESMAPWDVSSPTTVVGNGMPASCTAAALQAAATVGGIIVFDCGEEPVTITVTSAITVTKAAVIDGGGRITLSGGGASRILYFDSAYDLTTPRLVVQRLTFRDGRSAPGGDDTAVGGGAIYRDGGSLTVIDCTFIGNRAPSPGQDIAGGAIYAFGGGETVIAGSTFTDNAASNGGAVGSLNGDLTIINSVFSGNAATGNGGNPGNGGCGGAVYMDGADEQTRLCGVRIANNTAGAIAGGFFRVSNHDNGTFTMDRSTVDGNRVTPETSGNAGGMYLQGLSLQMTNSTISRNRAFYNGGLWLHTSDVQLTNVTVAENTAFGSNGGGLWLSNLRAGSTLTNVTIANNRSTAKDQISGAIFGSGLTLKNTLIAGNTAMWVPGCNEVHAGSGNLEWPDNANCSASPWLADPLLGELGDHGGDTQTMVPAPGSPARGLGTGCPPVDQRGVPRAEPCTAGAVEVP